MAIVNEIYKTSQCFPKELFGVRSQATRVAVSLPANIAEGSAKKSEKEFRHNLECALGSAFEFETHLLIVKVQKWFREENIDELLAKVNGEQRMVSSFINRLKLDA